ncbi:MAG: carbonic anhydrase [Gammaproteobacteria bacterium]
MIIPALEALQRLKEGNQRFAAGKAQNSQCDEELRRKLANGQDPYAVILGCADSRVPAELLFDQGLGDLFVVRVAGNIADPSLIGSVEFAAAKFGVRLVVVLGHSCCGAIEATIGELRNPGGVASPNLSDIVNRISPAIEELVSNSSTDADAALIEEAVRINVAATVKTLRADSDILSDLEQNDGLQIVGAEYFLDSGTVEFFK